MRNSIFVITSIALISFNSFAEAQTPSGSVESRLFAIEQRIGALERQLGVAAAAPVDDLAQRLDALDQQIRIVDRQREIDQDALKEKTAAAASVEASREGFAIRSAGNDFLVRVGGYIQADSRFFMGKNPIDTSAFVMRRIRPIIQGTIYKNVDFRIMTDFGSGNVIVQEAYSDVRYWKKASLRFGKFKAPFGLERLQSAADLTFVDRGLPTALAPNRDEGVQLFGDFMNGVVNYAAAVMNGVVDGGINETDSNSSKDFVGRAFLQPRAGLGLGLAVSRGKQSGTQLASYKSVGQSTFFAYAAGTTADGQRTRIGPQMFYYAGPFGLMAEYTSSSQVLRRGAIFDDVTNRAWQLQGSYFLTGERKSYRAISPLTAFDPSTRGAGALELTGRYSELRIDPTAFANGFSVLSASAQRAREWIAGLNWYLNRNSRFLFDYEQTHFTGGAASGNRETERGILSRFQVSF